MFVRFITGRIDPQSGKPQGIFQAAYRIRRARHLEPHDAERLDAALEWFDEHLARPKRLSRSRRPHRQPKAICWFKSGASEHLARAREIVSVLDGRGVFVETVWTRRPGYVVYEDAAQVAAYPFRDSR